jgi:hypothetical protein
MTENRQTSQGYIQGHRPPLPKQCGGTTGAPYVARFTGTALRVLSTGIEIYNYFEAMSKQYLLNF